MTTEILRVLCVEDDPDIRLLLEMVLTPSQGFELCLAEDAEQALRDVVSFNPDLLLLDYMLPGMTGLEFFRQLRSQPHWAALPGILLTAKVSNSTPAEWLQSGLLGVIAKPFDPLSLAGQLRSLYQGRET
ncbi:response regulator [Marinospirillum alkaliphilum]|uniref:Response regulator receiver domain-containing protein n=1 Tax=Marinospirillum alkaliphilum DSM 21637 TaxID=1122209 RepID=A0A1K1X2X7_9GAMM|nr:response regulator [Marinospirillum alkaliphilum]SFX43998.1 Response regulator receiver domain-containing protein [Marinospirillum alkaliphilum DSM 21637]